MSDEKAKEKAKKQIPLRVSASLYAEISADGMCKISEKKG